MQTFFSTSRTTGLLYLGLAITGMFAFLFARAELYVAGDPSSTVNNHVSQEGLARFGIAAELALVAFQAVTALWFYKLFKKVNSFAAIGIAAFGLVNTVGILVANAFWYSSLNFALSNETALSYMLFDLHESAWLVSAIFFGLWLIPMGVCALAAKMPKALGWILIGGGVGYMVSTLLKILAPEIPSSVIEGLTVPASIGEFWMLGYLLFKKVKA